MTGMNSTIASVRGSREDLEKLFTDQGNQAGIHTGDLISVVGTNPHSVASV